MNTLTKLSDIDDMIITSQDVCCSTLVLSIVPLVSSCQYCYLTTPGYNVDTCSDLLICWFVP